MANIITKTLGSNPKDAALTNAELDNNFINLNEELITKINKNTVEYPSFTQSLHKSPNAITSMFIYDTSKDSDGGAWTDKCQNTSWYNEPLSGNWLGRHPSEVNARCYNSTVGSDIAVNGSFTTDTNWTKDTGVTINNGTAIFTNVANNTGATATVSPLTSNNWYCCILTVSSYTSGGIMVQLGNTNNVLNVTKTGVYTVYAQAINSAAFKINAVYTTTLTIDSVVIKPVLSLNTSPNDYFQLIGNGNFYSLSKNYLTTTATLATQTQFLTAGTYTISSTTASSGSVAISGAATATHTAGTPTTFNVTTSGAVTFTVTGSVLTAQVELGTSATTYSPNTSTTRYTETFRGNKKEFPKLAAIVTEVSNLTIYDLTEKNNPMWMRFIVLGSPGSMIGYTSNVSGCFALNGIMLVGKSPTSSTVDVLPYIEFIKDSSIMHSQNTRYATYTTSVGKNYNNIAKRNSTILCDGTQGYNLTSEAFSSISMAILPNAPTDPVTGLKVPTIALAGNASVHIITNKGTLLTGATAQSYTRVILTPKRLYLTRGTLSNVFYYADNPANLANSFAVTSSTGTELNTDTIRNYIINKNKMGKIGYNKSELQLALLNDKSIAKSCFANIGQSFNSGYEIGDIRRSYLSSSVSETITSTTELLLNNSFSDSSAWTVLGGYGITIANDKLNFDGVTAFIHGAIFLSQNVSVIAGKTYKIEISHNIVGHFGIYLNGVGARTDDYTLVSDVPIYVTPTVTGTVSFYLVFLNGPNPLIGFINSISLIKDFISDRSYNKQRANVYGSITKLPVNTGSDLVAYSGFSNTNYIEDIYSYKLDFYTFEFNISCWVNIPINNNLAGIILQRGNASGASIIVSNNTTNNIIVTLYDGTTTKTVTTSAAYNTGTFIKVSASYKFGKLSIFVNGIEVGTHLGLPLLPLYYKKNLLNHTEDFNNSYWRKGAVTVIDGELDPEGAVTVIDGELDPEGSNTAWKITHTAQYASVNGITRSFELLSGTFTYSIWLKRLSGSNLISISIHNGAYYQVLSINPTNEWAKYTLTYTGKILDFAMLQDRNTSGFGVTLFWHPQLEFNNIATEYVSVGEEYEFEGAPKLTIGNSYDLTKPFPGSLSLLKISGTVPTKEQELFMYEQEKQLFNPNTKCVLPDSATVMYDVSYDNYNDKFLLNSSLNMSEWNGLVRTNNIPISIGTYVSNESVNGIKLIAQQGGNTGADVIKPNYNIKKKVSEKDSYSKSITFPVELVDYIGGFTGTTVLNSNVITSNDIPSYDIIGTTIAGTGIPANTTILDISGTSIYIDALATAAGSVNISFLEYNLPIGYTTKYIVKNGVYLTEGATKDYTILYDGFRETIKLVATPNYQDWIQLQITKKPITE